MKKLVVMFLTAMLLCSCSAKEPKKETVEKPEETIQKEYEAPNDFKGYCIFGEFDKFNSYASENGLGGTMIWLEGSYDKIEEITINNQKGYYTQFKDSDNHLWILLLDLDMYSGIETFESLINHPLVVTGSYSGYSKKYNMPAFNMKSLFDKQSGITVNSTLFKLTNEETIISNEETKENNNEINNEIDENTIRPEIKEAIDSFEAFIDEYCAFMVKYSESDGKDLSLLTDYASFISKLADMESKMDKLEEDFTEAESYYYAEVSLRCSRRLLEASR